MPKKAKKLVNSEGAEEAVVKEEALDAEQVEEEESDDFFLPALSNLNMLLISGVGVSLVIIMVLLVNGSGQSAEAAYNTTAASAEPMAAVSAPLAQQVGDVVSPGGIERKGEGRHFYTTIKIPAGAETLYLSGSGASSNPDGSWGDMEAQTIDTFNGFREKLEAEGWSMSDIVQVRAFAVADEFGLLDFDGFNRAYRQFFGTEENPMKPVRSFVEIEDLVVDGWLVEIEVRAARMPQG